MKFLASKMAVVQCVAELLKSSETDWQWITITRAGTSEAFCVQIVTDMLSEDIVKTVEQIYFNELMRTSLKNTEGG